MKAVPSAKGLDTLQYEINNCRQTVLFLEDSLRHSDEIMAKEDPRKDYIDSLLQQVTEKDKQLRVIEEMLSCQKLARREEDETGISRTFLMRKAIDNRINTHWEDLNKVKEYYYNLILETKVA
jgi:hypothetical protein